MFNIFKSIVKKFLHMPLFRPVMYRLLDMTNRVWVKLRTGGGACKEFTL